ncbi:hypothetical protein PFICI_04320 [Pestalotiopsis fici W106-1]|uniref:Uncharacterized protein n=1 Tax=Pestalotiopsis fici (strain W106-1 / CGMCC3.15140) TaxID=1229662 RepID=W3X8U0_PESFW|nr:uncharacterized protein PFICI_04320 [Pestalotiopsis fici W106-1]ETS82444.1 hypothetical protein PFICI_04320 [Pestalotiopsis fici W106-1]
MIGLVNIPMQSTTGLYAPRCAIKAWQLTPFEAAAFNQSNDQQVDEIQSYCSRVRSATGAGSNTLFIIPQEYSRGSLKITEPCVDALATSIHASPMFKTMINSFERDLTDYYIGRALLEFSPSATLDSQGSAKKAFEFCCLLPYIEKNQHKVKHLGADNCYREVLQWSVRQQGLYSSYNSTNPKTETTVLVNPADELWRRIKSTYGGVAVNLSVDEGWQSIPCRVFESLTANWATYIACLHRAVEQIKRDAAVTHFDQPFLGEANTQSLRDGMDMMDRLETAHHVLGNIISTLSQIQAEALKHEQIWTRNRAEAEQVTFSHRVKSVVRQLEFERSQVERITTRLKGVVAMVRNSMKQSRLAFFRLTRRQIRDLVNLRSTNNMEKMTARTIMEARTMRIIAVVTLCFLPPTFIAGFLDMGYIKVASGGGQLLVNAEPGLLLYTAITIPVVLVILGGYLWWDWRTTRNLTSSLDPV